MLYIPYRRLFQQIRTIAVPGMGDWEVYANRDSLGYIKAYGLEEASTVFERVPFGIGDIVALGTHWLALAILNRPSRFPTLKI